MHSGVIAVLKTGGIAVIPTDTVYGVVASARNRKAVKRLYRLRRKQPHKPFIVLISSILELQEFGITLTPVQTVFLKKIWPGKVSVILKVPHARFPYLHLGTKTLAFRLPRSRPLLRILRETGPLVAPSANPEGKKPAQTIKEARRYFGQKVATYVSANRRLQGKPSTLASLTGAKPKILREGSVLVKL